jgi:hypothetical protein
VLGTTNQVLTYDVGGDSSPNKFMKPHRRQKIFIRIQNLSSETISDLNRSFPNSEIRTNERKVVSKDKAVALLYLEPSFDCEKFSQFLAKRKISKKITSFEFLWLPSNTRMGFEFQNTF